MHRKASRPVVFELIKVRSPQNPIFKSYIQHQASIVCLKLGSKCLQPQRPKTFVIYSFKKATACAFVLHEADHIFHFPSISIILDFLFLGIPHSASSQQGLRCSNFIIRILWWKFEHSFPPFVSQRNFSLFLAQKYCFSKVNQIFLLGNQPIFSPPSFFTPKFVPWRHDPSVFYRAFIRELLPIWLCRFATDTEDTALGWG